MLQDAAHSVRSRAVAALVLIAAHELRTPLADLTTQAQVALAAEDPRIIAMATMDRCPIFLARMIPR